MAGGPLTMYHERSFSVPADTAYGVIVDEVLPSFAPRVVYAYGPLRMSALPMKIVAKRVDENPAYAHHLILQCAMQTPTSRSKLGGPLHVDCADTETGVSPRSRVSVDTGNSDEFGGAVSQALMALVPGVAWRYVAWANRTVRLNVQVGDGEIISWDPAWRTKDAYVKGLGRALLNEVAELVLGDVGARLDRLIGGR